ncbi:hypothetical protein BJN34_18980 [Cupriavidus necator]|uniref:Uncharacterized protein n=2 Tax=Cupriavidus necator TaxID=106590 RepID=A0A1U9UTJ1_CUPNE|nr:hypothetical protein BJN34_18980 [Cupriavidus necator]
MVPRIPRRPGRHTPLRSRWWQPGVYGSVPAVGLWIMARLPAGLLLSLAGTPAAATWLNHAGDTVFVSGWTASALLLWLARRKPAPAAPAHPPAQPSPPPLPSAPSGSAPHRHSAG